MGTKAHNFCKNGCASAFSALKGIFAQLKTHFIQMGILYQETVSQKLNFYYELTTWSRISKCYITDSAEDGTSKYPWGNFAYIRPHNLFRQSHLCFDRIAKIIIILGYHHLLWMWKISFQHMKWPSDFTSFENTDFFSMLSWQEVLLLSSFSRFTSITIRDKLFVY